MNNFTLRDQIEYLKQSAMYEKSDIARALPKMKNNVIKSSIKQVEEKFNDEEEYEDEEQVQEPEEVEQEEEEPAPQPVQRKPAKKVVETQKTKPVFKSKAQQDGPKFASVSYAVLPETNMMMDAKFSGKKADSSHRLLRG